MTPVSLVRRLICCSRIEYEHFWLDLFWICRGLDCKAVVPGREPLGLIGTTLLE